MITTHSRETPYRTLFTSRVHQAYADASAQKGGSGSGFGPHSLLEASVGCCMNIWLRMYADKHDLPLSGVTAKVSLIRDVPGEALFQYAIELNGPLSEDQRQELLEQLKSCPVYQTLSRRVSFRQIEED